MPFTNRLRRRILLIIQLVLLALSSSINDWMMNPCSALSVSAAAASSKSESSSAANTKSLRDLVAPDPPPDLHPVYDSDDGEEDPPKRLLIKTPTRLNYVAPETVKATVRRDPSGRDSDVDGVAWDEHTVWVENGRRTAGGRSSYRLHRHGFELIANDPVPRYIDFSSKDDVLDNYYPHCEKLLERYLRSAAAAAAAAAADDDLAAGVTVKAFDHNVRKQIPDDGDQKPLGVVHGDYTSTSAPRRLQLLANPPKINDVWRERLGESPLLDAAVVDECLAGKRRYAFINVWRNIDIDQPIQSFPLACMDAQSCSREDLRVLELHYEDRVGENFLACPAAEQRHRWIFFPDMMYEEALLIKQWDSWGDLAKDKPRDEALSTMSIHSAFLDPRTIPTAPPRQSIEVRCVAIWEPSKEVAQG